MPLAVHNGPRIRPGRVATFFRGVFALAAPPRERLLALPYVQQEQNNWCWAACCQMLLRHFGKPALDQCQIAEREFHGSCCQNPASATCDAGQWPETAYPSHGIQLNRIEGILSDGGLRGEIDAGRPVEVYYVWQGGLSAHVALVTGYYSNGDFEVFDPARTFGRGRRAYDRIVAAYGLGQWRLSYSNIRG